MKDIFEFIADLRELQHLYATQDLCYLDFQEKLSKWEDAMEQFDTKELEAFENELF